MHFSLQSHLIIHGIWIVSSKFVNYIYQFSMFIPCESVFWNHLWKKTLAKLAELKAIMNLFLHFFSWIPMTCPCCIHDRKASAMPAGISRKTKACMLSVTFHGDWDMTFSPYHWFKAVLRSTHHWFICSTQRKG